MDILSGFHDISLAQLVLVAGVAFIASLIGGVAGYGTGALMPLVLVPIVGAAPIVPMIAISALFNNTSRMTAFLRYVDWRRSLIVIVCAAPTCVVGAWGYAHLSGAGAAFVIGAMLIASVPLRRVLKRRAVTFGDGGLAVASVGYGVVALVGIAGRFDWIKARSFVEQWWVIGLAVVRRRGAGGSLMRGTTPRSTPSCFG